VPLILGGDWNLTYSTLDVPQNPDVLNMNSTPSIVRSGWLLDLCEQFSLINPFRAFHPTNRDYTFVPHGAKKHRSRLDFFLVSSSLLNNIKSCNIQHNLTCAGFDHKPVFLDFSKNKSKSKPYVNRTITNNPRTDDVVLAAFADTYLAHASVTQLPVFNEHVHHARGVNQENVLDSQKRVVANLMRLIHEYNDISDQIAQARDNALLKLQLAEKNTEILLMREQVWEIDRFSSLQLNCSDDLFLEALLSNIKGSVISFQTWVRRHENLRKSLLISELNRLRLNYSANQDLIYELENELNAITDAEVLLKVRSMQIFSCLNNERPTPIFLSLARSNSSNNKMSNIRQDDGTPYASDVDRNEGIVSYYENIYRKPSDDHVDYAGCVPRFLGSDVANHQIVQNSKLSEEEKVRLDSPLLVTELDDAVAKCNVRSAPGVDGLSNLFIKNTGNSYASHY
jgi:hypothetical protein